MRRFFDIAVSTIGLIATAIPAVFIIPAVRLSVGKPIIFKQLRLGKNKEPFLIYKFNTMPDTRNKKGNLLPDEERLTPVGRFLKRTSLDELPQFFNVLKGDMSLIGPRPIMPHEVIEGYDERFDVKQGLTGLTQIGSNRGINKEPAFSEDVWYTKNRTAMLDLRIIFSTPIAVALGTNSISTPSTKSQKRNPDFKYVSAVCEPPAQLPS